MCQRLSPILFIQSYYRTVLVDAYNGVPWRNMMGHFRFVDRCGLDVTEVC